MKKSFLFYFAAFCLLCLSSCEKKPAPIDDNGEEEVEYVEVGLKPKGIDISIDTRSTRASSDDLYGMAVYKGLINDPNGKYDSGSGYAGWLTEDLSSEKLKLKKGEVYYIVVLYIPNAKKILADYESGTVVPFGALSQKFAKLGEGICYGDYASCAFNGGAAKKKGDKNSGMFSTGYFYSDVEAYQGEALITATGDMTIDINLYSIMFGLTVNITKFSEGSIRVSFPANGDEYGNNSFELTPSNPSVSRVIELGSPYFFDDIKEMAGGLEMVIDYFDKEGKAYRLAKYENGWITRMSRVNVNIDLEAALESIEAGLNPYVVPNGEWKDIDVNLF